jgi:hypothetical protein
MGVLRSEEQPVDGMASRDRAAVREPLRAPAAKEPADGPEREMGDRDDRNELVRRMGAVLANVAVLTALLVYFG